MSSSTISEGSIKAAAHTANTIRSHSTTYRTGIRTNHELAMNFAASLQDMALGDAELEEELNQFIMEQKLRIMKNAEQNCLLERQVDAFLEALSNVQEELNQSSAECDFETILSSKLIQATEKQPPFQPQESPLVQELQTALGLQNTDLKEEEEELQVLPTHSNNLSSLKCPISGGILVDPVRSQVCNHVYSKEALEQYVAQNHKRGPKSKCKCPVVGCTNTKLTLKSCESDSRTAMAVKRYQRKQAQEQEILLSQAADAESDEDNIFI
jgi:E3 SUMO-protein ligase NSE2